MKLLLSIFALTILVSCEPKPLPTYSDIQEDKVIIKVSHETTRSEMATFYRSLKESHNIEFNYTKSTFFEDGKLRILKLYVTLPSGERATTTADLMTLQKNYYGMIYDKSGEKGVSFKIGKV